MGDAHQADELIISFNLVTTNDIVVDLVRGLDDQTKKCKSNWKVMPINLIG